MAAREIPADHPPFAALPVTMITIDGAEVAGVPAARGRRLKRPRADTGTLRGDILGVQHPLDDAGRPFLVADPAVPVRER